VGFLSVLLSVPKRHKFAKSAISEVLKICHAVSDLTFGTPRSRLLVAPAISSFTLDDTAIRDDGVVLGNGATALFATVDVRTSFWSTFSMSPISFSWVKPQGLEGGDDAATEGALYARELALYSASLRILISSCFVKPQRFGAATSPVLPSATASGDSPGFTSCQSGKQHRRATQYAAADEARAATSNVLSVITPSVSYVVHSNPFAYQVCCDASPPRRRESQKKWSSLLWRGPLPSRPVQ
jgi:hypothetical protein